jgi:hypothetical protein
MQVWNPIPEQAAEIEAEIAAAALRELQELANGPWSDATLTAEDRRALHRGL